MGRRDDRLFCGIRGCSFLADNRLELAYHRHYFHDPYGDTTPFHPPRNIITNENERYLARKISHRNGVIRRLEKHCSIEDLKDKDGNKVVIHADTVGNVIQTFKNGKKKSICGGHIKDQEGSVCTLSAGWGTAHPKIGPCKHHDSHPRRERVTFLSEYTEESHSLARSLAKIDLISETELYDQYTIIKTLYALLDANLQENVLTVEIPEGYEAGDTLEIPQVFSSEKERRIIKIIQEIRKVMKTRAEILNMLVYNPSDIRRFIETVFKVVARYVPSEMISDLNRDLREKVVLRVGGGSELPTLLPKYKPPEEKIAATDVTPYDRYEDLEEEAVPPSPEDESDDQEEQRGKDERADR